MHARLHSCRLVVLDEAEQFACDVVTGGVIAGATEESVAAAAGQCSAGWFHGDPPV